MFDLAIADYSKAIEINPHYDVAYDNRGVAYCSKGNFDACIEDCTKVRVPTEAGPVERLGRV